MATNEYNPEQTGTRSELDEPRRTTESEGGYGGGSENVPPHHKIHTDDEPLPKPTGGNYDDEQFSTPGAGAGGKYDDDSTEKFQDSRSGEPQTGSYDDTPETRPRGFGGEEKSSGGYSDPSSAFPGAPVDRTVEEPGYGQDTRGSDPLSTGTGTGPESPTPKKEGFVQKLKDKLPGHHKTAATPDTVDDETPVDGGTPKKGLITKIKEKLPGHSPTTPTTE